VEGQRWLHRAEAERKARAEKENVITLDAQKLYAIFNKALNTTEPHKKEFAWAFEVADKLEKMEGPLELKPTTQA
jgi:hypothetical protein